MKETILKLIIAIMVSMLLYVSTGCDGKRRPRKGKKIRSSSEIAKSPKKQTKTPAKKTQKRTSSVGVGDVADYATGTIQLKAKKRSKTRLKNIYSTHDKERKKALEE